MKNEGINMIYKCDNKYLTASLISFKNFKLVGSIKKDNIYFLIECPSKIKLIKKLEQYLNNVLKVDFEKYKENLNIIQKELDKY